MAIAKKPLKAATTKLTAKQTIIYGGNAYDKKICVELDPIFHFLGEFAPESKCAKSYYSDTYYPIQYSNIVIVGVSDDNLEIKLIPQKGTIKYSALTENLLKRENFIPLYCVDFNKIASKIVEQIYGYINSYGESRIYFKNVEVLSKIGFVECIPLGKFVNKEQLAKLNKMELSDYEKFDMPDNIRMMSSPQDLVKYGAKSPSFIKTEGKKYTFGVEIETIRGIVPYYVRQDFNMCAKFDGSLRLEDGKAHGAEYITGVLTGDAGLVHLHSMVKEISRRCAINKQCSVHVHIGTVDFDQAFIVYMYKLGLYLENELFAIMPKSRAASEYCRKMTPLDLPVEDGSSYEPSILNAYQKIHKIISAVDRPEDYKLSKEKDHPLGHCCGYNRNTPRYWWLNFVPAMYNIRGNKSYTIEFRNHSSTMNYKKIENWILICMGLVNFVENHKRLIQPGIKLKDVLKVVYPKSHNYLIQYVNKRKEAFGSGKDNELDEYAKESNSNVKQTRKELIIDVHNRVQT